MYKFSKNRGFTLVEMIVYVAILSVIFVMVVNTILIVSRSYKSIKLTNDINNSASISMERLTREIRRAGSVNTSGSVFSTNPGRLVLDTTDEMESATTYDFYIEGDILKLKKGGIFSGSLIRDNIDVTNLIFHHITSSSSEAIKIEMELTGINGNTTKVKNFYSTAVLRGSY